MQIGIFWIRSLKKGLVLSGDPGSGVAFEW